MTDSVNLMVEYGGLDAKAKDNPKAFYTNDYLPNGPVIASAAKQSIVTRKEWIASSLCSSQ